jgi:hypothetical protein
MSENAPPPIISPEQQWRAELAATLDRIEEKVNRLLEKAMLAEEPTGRGLGH